MKQLQWTVIVIVALILLIALAGLLVPRAHRVSRLARFSQSPATIFAAITGPQDWRGVVTTDLPAVDGRRRWTEKSGWHVVTFEETARNAPLFYCTQTADPNLPFSGTWTWEITPTEGGCTCRITEAADVRNPVYRLIGRFVIGYSKTIDDYLASLGRKFGERVEIER